MARRSDPISLTDKVVLITGAGSGVGQAAAMAFARAGSRLALIDIQEESVSRTGDAIAADGFEKPLVVPADLGQEVDLQRIVATVRERCGRIDVLINNAGLGQGGRFEDHEPERAHQLLQVNLWAVLRLTQLVLPIMRGQGSGHIVNVSSQAAILAVPGYSVYTAAKAGLAAFTQVLRRELAGTGITLTLFFPGPTETNMTRAMRETRAGTARIPHHGPEKPAQRMVDAVRHRRREVIVSSSPKMQALMRLVEKLAPSLLDSYWEKSATDSYFATASRSGEKASS